MKVAHRSVSCPRLRLLSLFATVAVAPVVFGQHVTFSPYIQLGDAGPFGPADQVVVAWQTDESKPSPSAYKVEIYADKGGKQSVTPKARVVDNYLAADPSLPAIPTAYGAHANYTAVLAGLAYDTQYHYRITGPGMPEGGFTASYHTRKLGPVYSFVVEGDEGQFPVDSNVTPSIVVDYEARIAHLIHDAAKISLPNVAPRPEPEFILNTGDNVYTYGSEGNYRDFFFPVYNNDVDSNETGAPIIRSKLFFPVDGNHDLGSTGVSDNLLASDTAAAYSGNQNGGDALSYFNDFYFPQNGPKGYDILYDWNVNTAAATGMTFSYLEKNYTSPAAIEAFRQSTAVDTGKGTSLQIDHQSNYSFDYGNAHILYLDANPHLFNDNLPGGNAYNAAPPTFVAYPTELGKWVIKDLDSSRQQWKIVIFHQPSFSSGDSTIVNGQMRSVAKLLEDHGVNMVFNGHEHNYQRTLPIRATAITGSTPTTANGPLVEVDPKYDGVTDTVPDGVLYLVEGAGGNRDFDGNYAPPRGSGVGLDQDDSATGTFTDEPGLTVPQGPASWLDVYLTNPEFINFVPNAGQGTKITTKFKAKVFSFGHVVVDHNQLTLFQISEPLQSTTSATAADPAPYGTDINGNPLNDPIPDTQVDPTTGEVISVPGTGQPALLDKWTVVKPDLTGLVSAQISGPKTAQCNDALTYQVTINNTSSYNLNGTQVRFRIPQGEAFAGTVGGAISREGDELVITVGRVPAGETQIVSIPMQVNADAQGKLLASANVSSGTAETVVSNKTATSVQ